MCVNVLRNDWIILLEIFTYLYPFCIFFTYHAWHRSKISFIKRAFLLLTLLKTKTFHKGTPREPSFAVAFFSSLTIDDWQQHQPLLNLCTSTLTSCSCWMGSNCRGNRRHTSRILTTYINLEFFNLGYVSPFYVSDWIKFLIVFLIFSCSWYGLILSTPFSFLLLWV